MNGAPQGGVQAADMVGLYSGHPIKLWIEDMITRAYLQDCWNDPQIGFLIAGSNEGVVSVVNLARTDGFSHVFGLIDRDFGTSNRNRWSAADGPIVFRPDVHEIENELLNPDHLAGCDLNNQGRSAPDIMARLRTHGGGVLWRFACRSVLTDLHADVSKDFPSHSMVHTQQEAVDHILNSAWYKHMSATVPAWNQSEITRRLTAGFANAQTLLHNGQYLVEFSGKEMLRDLHTWLYKPPSGSGATAAERDQDLARSLAKFQTANNQVPQEVVDMRLALRQRVGI